MMTNCAFLCASNNMDLQNKHCVPCEGGVAPLTAEALKPYFDGLKSKWELVDDKKIRRVFTFKDFKEAMIFVNNVADVAEAEQHHPDITVSWNVVTIELWTHSIGGLSENDFIVAAKIENI